MLIYISNIPLLIPSSKKKKQLFTSSQFSVAKIDYFEYYCFLFLI